MREEINYLYIAKFKKTRFFAKIVLNKLERHLELTDILEDATRFPSKNSLIIELTSIKTCRTTYIIKKIEEDKITQIKLS